MLHFKAGNESSQIPISGDGIYISENGIGYDIANARHTADKPEWNMLALPTVYLIQDGVRSDTFTSSLHNNNMTFKETIYDNNVPVVSCVQSPNVSNWGWLGLQIDLTGVSRLRFIAACGTGVRMGINDNFNPASIYSANPMSGATNIVSYSIGGNLKELTWDASELSGTHSLYMVISNEFRPLYFNLLCIE